MNIVLLNVPDKHDNEAEHRRLLARRSNSGRTWNEQHLDPEQNPHPQYVLVSQLVYGQLYLDTPTQVPDLGAGWQTLPFDTGASVQQHISFDLDANTFTFEMPLVSVICATGALDHNDSAQARSTRLRMYNATQGVAASNVLAIPAGRNATAFAATIVRDIPAEFVGDAFRAEIGNGDSFTAVELTAFNIGFWGHAHA